MTAPSIESKDVTVISRSHWRTREILMRMAWTVCEACLFRFSPKPFHRFRACLLRWFGARIDTPIWIANSVKIVAPWKLAVGEYTAIGPNVTLYNLAEIDIGKRAVISQGAHLCCGTRDYGTLVLPMPLIALPIQVGDNAWICAEAFLGPGIVVGEGSVVGARACVVKNVDPWTVVVGNPARFVHMRNIRGENSGNAAQESD